MLNFLIFFQLVNFHVSYFAFGEMEYKPESKTIELSLLFTSHDIEKEWLQNKIIENKLANISHEKSSLLKIQKELNNSFVLEKEGEYIVLELQDFELKNDGNAIFYLSKENVELSGEVYITFNTLMNTFPKQQNKLTFIQKGIKKTYVFLKENKKQKIDIIN